jgi:hypothetical protein
LRHGRKDCPAVRDPLVADQHVEIIPDRLREFGLRIQEIHDAQIRREPRYLPLEQGAGNTAPLGQGLALREARPEIAGRFPNSRSAHQGMAGSPGFATPVSGIDGRGSGGQKRRIEKGAQVEALRASVCCQKANRYYQWQHDPS